MYGLIVKLTIVPGKRDEMVRVLKESAIDMQGCVSYVVAKDLRMRMCFGLLRSGTVLRVTLRS
jgi:quinol monooxygenase YgiN